MTPARGVLLSWDGTTPGESFCPGMKRLQGSPSVLGWKNSGESFSTGETTPEESFCPGMEELQGSHSIPGQKDSRGFILSCYRSTPEESIRPGME